MERIYRDYFNEKPYNTESKRYWYTHKIVRRLFTVIKKVLPYKFVYHKDEIIPKLTNHLESFFNY